MHNLGAQQRAQRRSRRCLIRPPATRRCLTFRREAVPGIRRLRPRKNPETPATHPARTRPPMLTGAPGESKSVRRCAIWSKWDNMARKLAAELLGTALLVYFAVGVATLSFGFDIAGSSFAAGVVATALAFGLVLLALAYVLGPDLRLSRQPGGHPGRPAGPADLARRGGRVLGRAVRRRDPRRPAAVGMFSASPGYSRATTGLGTNGWGAVSDIHIGLGGAFLAEVVLTALFVFVVLGVTGKLGNTATAGMVIGLSLTVVHLIGIPITGTSVNPARSLGPALIVGGTALSQVWLFIVAPLVGGAIAAGLHVLILPKVGGPSLRRAAGTALRRLSDGAAVRGADLRSARSYGRRQCTPVDLSV